MSKQMTVTLSSWDLGTKKVAVSSLSEAVEVAMGYISEHNFGGSELGFNFGLVREGSKPVAVVSYNGRVWEPEMFERGHYRGNGTEIEVAS